MAGQVQGKLPNFSLAAFRRARAPQDLFKVITNGRVEKTMPPFASSLTDAERWDVTAYLYTLSASTETLEQGQKLFTANCAACHGVTGQGDGPQSVSALPDFTAPEFFATQFEQNFFQAMTTGHVFTETLTEDERWAVSAYVRSLGYQSQPTTAPTPSNGLVTVRGKVTNGTAGAKVPADLPVVLHIFEDVTETNTYTTTPSSGVYTLADIPLKPQQSVAVTADYGGVRYASQILEFKGTETRLDLPVQIFETTTDPGAIRIATWHVFFQVKEAGMVQVGELITFANAGDRTFTAPQAGEATVKIPLPPGAANLQFDDGALGERYLAEPDGFAHTAVVRPGAKSLSTLFSFDLPLARRLDFAQTTRYPVEAVNVLAPNGALELKSQQLSGPQTQNVEGTAYLIYTGATILAGDDLVLTVTPAGANANLGSLAVGGLLILAVAALGVGWFGLSKKRKASGPVYSPRRQELIQAIAQLDERFAGGEGSEAEYRIQRAKLKAEALRLTERKEDL